MSDLGVVPECCPVLSDKLAANPSAAQVLAAIGDFGEIGGDEEAHSKATASAKHAAFHSRLLVRQRWLCFGSWIDAFGAIYGGTLYLFSSVDAGTPDKTLQMNACTATVGERQGCKSDSYCFSVVLTECACEGGERQSVDAITLCARQSKELLLWMQALVAAGCRYADDDKYPPALSQSVATLFDLSANDLDSGKPVDFSEYKGCVCLIVNVATV
jgi:hypothetical protein